MADDFRSLALTNYGHFTSMRAEHGRVRGLALHLERLRRDARTLFDIELDTDAVREECRRHIEGIETAMVRVTVAGHDFDMSHPAEPVKPNVLVTARAAAELPAPPHRVQTVPFHRDVPAAKHVGLFGSLYLRRQAQLAEFDDVLFLDSEDHIYEGATWNVVCVSGDRVIWPIGETLPGVTMRLLRQSHPGVEAYVPRSELSGMDAIAEVNANVGIRPIIAVDDIEFPADHPVFDHLRSTYDDVPWESL